MSDTDNAALSVDTAQYIHDNFEPEDRLAVVLINKRVDAVVQRLASAKKVAAPGFLSWLHRLNAQRYEVYLSMNASQPDAQNRTKGQVATIRHIYLDVDENGTAAKKALLNRADLPKPNYMINSSPDKWQVVWKVSGFDKEQAENLQKNLARECGADTATTDCARVLRLPGYLNHKYATAYLIRAEGLATDTYSPNHFPKTTLDKSVDNERPVCSRSSSEPVRIGGITQSERDWAFAKRSLARGDPPYLIVAAIASYRRFDKHNPQDYAARTVAKAAAELQAEQQSWAVNREMR